MRRRGITINLYACDSGRLKYFSQSLLFIPSSHAVCVPARNTLHQTLKSCRRYRDRDSVVRLSGFLTELPPRRHCEEPIVVAQEAHRHQGCKRAHIPRTNLHANVLFLEGGWRMNDSCTGTKPASPASRSLTAAPSALRVSLQLCLHDSEARRSHVPDSLDCFASAFRCDRLSFHGSACEMRCKEC